MFLNWWWWWLQKKKNISNKNKNLASHSHTYKSLIQHIFSKQYTVFIALKILFKQKIIKLYFFSCPVKLNRQYEILEMFFRFRFWPDCFRRISFFGWGPVVLKYWPNPFVSQILCVFVVIKSWSFHLRIFLIIWFNAISFVPIVVFFTISDCERLHVSIKLKALHFFFSSGVWFVYYHSWWLLNLTNLIRWFEIKNSDS